MDANVQREQNRSSVNSNPEKQSSQKKVRSERSPTSKTPALSSTKLARGLGWFSVGLGMTELFWPKAITKVAGLSDENTALIRLYGLRELASGGAIFMQNKPTEAMWSRVVGDAIDLASLGASFNTTGTKRGRLAFAMLNVLTVTALDVICASQLGQMGGTKNLDNQTPAQFFRQVRDEIFESNNEKFALALGSSSDMIRKLIAGEQLPDADLSMKVRALREKRTVTD